MFCTLMYLLISLGHFLRPSLGIWAAARLGPTRFPQAALCFSACICSSSFLWKQPFFCSCGYCPTCASHSYPFVRRFSQPFNCCGRPSGRHSVDVHGGVEYILAPNNWPQMLSRSVLAAGLYYHLSTRLYGYFSYLLLCVSRDMHPKIYISLDGSLTATFFSQWILLVTCTRHNWLNSTHTTNS